MYLLSMLSKQSLSFVNQTTASGGNRSKPFAIALGYVLARQLSLPAEPVEEISMYYRLQHAQSVLSELDSINECMPLDTRLARKMVEDFYVFRYRAANPAMIPLAFQKGSGVVDFFGISTVFSKDVLEEIEASPDKLTNFVNGLSALFADVKAKKVSNAASFEINQEQDRYVA